MKIELGCETKELMSELEKDSDYVREYFKKIGVPEIYDGKYHTALEIGNVPLIRVIAVLIKEIERLSK